MALTFRSFSVALIGASLLAITLTACGGGSSTLPQGAPQTGNGANESSAPGSSEASPVSAGSVIQVTDADRAAAASHGPLLKHIFPIVPNAKSVTESRARAQVVHASDLQYFGGALLQSAKIYNAFVDSNPSTFGNVALFESDLSRSNMIHITDEYVHSTANNRYPWAGDVRVNYPALATLGDNDLMLIVHAVAARLAGGGYNHFYHIFLPPNIVYCDPTGACTPNAPTPGFCAFHGSVSFSDIKNVVFALDPYSNIKVCNVDAFAANPNAPTPNGLQQDSLYSAVSHEQFESITDPNPPTGWANPFPFYSFEIGDLCAYIPGPFVNGIAQPQNSILNGKAYRIQFEYSNRQTGCANTPP